MNAPTPEERLTRLETTLEHLATKADLKAEVGMLKVDLKTEVGALKVDLIDRIGQAERRTTYWIIGALVLNVLAGLATKFWT